jgi:hypothetical protein
VLETGDGEWDVVRFKSAEQGRKFIDGMNEAMEEIASMPPAQRAQVVAELKNWKRASNSISGGGRS